MTVLIGYAYYALAWFGPDVTCQQHEYSFFWYASFMTRTFDFHFGLVFLGLAALFVGLRRYAVAGAMLPITLIGLMPTLKSYVDRDAHVQTPNFRVMSVNLFLVNRNHNPILQEILTEDPDLLILQEYTFRWHESIESALAARYTHRAVFPAEGAFGAAIYAKQPLTDLQRFQGDSLQNRSPYMRTAIQVGAAEFAVYNVHLVPPTWFNRKLMPRQFCQLRNALEHEQLPMIVGGDFNFSRGAAMDYQLRSLNLQEAHSEAGRGRGGTFKIRWMPDIAIDHVYLSPTLVPVHCRTGTGLGSDHRPLIVDLHID